jgi:ATP-dependent exoDNAse (exonuclease V) beta subunit
LGKVGGWLSRIETEDVVLEGREVPYDEEGAAAHYFKLRTGDTIIGCTLYEPGYVVAEQPLTPSSDRVEARPTPLPPPLLASVLPEPAQVDADTAAHEREPPQRVWRVVPEVERPRAPAWVVGSLVHAALATWRLPQATDEGFDRWVEARARGLGVTDPRQLRDAARQTRRLLSRFQAHPLYEEMSGTSRRLHEVPYSIWVDDQVESGVIDAVYASDAGWTIVEFKTDIVSDPDQFQRMLVEQGYLEQVQRYIRAFHSLLGQKPRFLLCMLNDAGRVRVYQAQEGRADGPVFQPSQDDP